MYERANLTLTVFILCDHTISYLFALRIASLDVKPAMSVLEKNLKWAKLKAFVKKSSLDGDVTVIVSVPGVTDADGAVEGPASSAKQAFDGADCFICETVSSLD